MHILFTGGGSGGHILPNLALCQKLKQEFPTHQLSYIGEKHGMEEELVTQAGIPFYGIHAGKLRRYFSFKNILDLFVIPLGILESFIHLLRLRPEVIFSKGGYVSLHVVIAAWILRKKIVIHESDVVPGLTTRLCAPFASTICVSWEKTMEFFKGKQVLRTGIPVREELQTGTREAGRTFAGLEENALPTLLVVGGSLGAGSINSFIYTNSKALLKKYNIIHLVGKGKTMELQLPKELQHRYAQLEFVGNEMKDLFACCDVILSRAGSTFLAECASIGKPIIMVPLPLSQSRGDQFDNAKEYMKLFPESSAIIEDQELNTILFTQKMDHIANTENMYLESSSSVGKILTLLLQSR